MSNARNLARVVADTSGAISVTNLSNAPNPIVAGTIAYLGMNSAPSGWLKANGAAVSRTTYAALYSAIGTTYGTGNGSTTFNLPDLRGYFPRGFDDGAGVDSGRSFGTTQADQFQGHAHGAGFGGSANYTAPERTLASSGSGWGNAPGFGLSNQVSLPSNDSPNGGNGGGDPRTGAETRPKNIALLACIKY